MTLGQRIKELRDKKGLSQDEVADKIGVSKSAVSLWEMDKNTPTSKKLIKLANLFGVDADYITNKKSTIIDETSIVEQNRLLREELNEVRKELAAAQKEYIELLKKINKP